MNLQVNISRTWGDERCQVLQAILIDLIVHLKTKSTELLLEVADTDVLARVVGHERRALESLAEDLVAGADSFGVESRREELATSLGQQD